VRIKRLELIGFKSSMEKTVLDFPEGITGIVGPNGCGKSNIIDALRWVLGEQSAKHLRGQSMEDVIFAGNSRYRPLGACEVTLTLDNQHSELPDADEDDESSELVRALRRVPELAITRRLFRSGESQYAINGRQCRLRDITELFLGTGVGTKAYSIIEQGRVGQIVSAKPEELRVFIEEAAGTTLYRSRKLAAERKIERTRDNLLRVSDVVRELERQANSLRRQAQGAVRFQELKARETEIDIRVSAFKLRILDDKLKVSREAFATTRGRAQAAALGQEIAGNRRGAARKTARSCEESTGRVRSSVFAARGAIERAEQEREYLGARRTELERAQSEAESESEQLTAEREQADAAALALSLDAQTASSDLETAGTERGAMEAERAELDQQLRAWEQRADSVKGRILEGLARQSERRNERAAVESRLLAEREHEQRLTSEQGSLDTVAKCLIEEVTSCRGRLDEVLGELQRTEGGHSSAADELKIALSRKREAEKEAEGARDDAAGLNSRYESLRELNDGFVGYGDGVRSFMSDGGRERTGAKAVVADVIEIERGFEAAVAAVLQDQLQYVVVPDADAGVEGAGYLRQTGAGRASFIPLVPRHSDTSTSVPPGYSLLSDHLRVEDGYERVVAPLLDGVVVAADLEQARTQWSANGYDATFVTLDGEVIRSSGLVTGGSERSLDAGILERKAELRILSQALVQADSRREVAQGTLEEVANVADTVGTQLEGLNKQLHELTVERVSAEGDLELRRQNLARTEERVGTVLGEVEELAGTLAQNQDRLSALDEELGQHDAALAEFEQERAGLSDEGRELDERRNGLAGGLESCRVAEAELRQKFQGLEVQGQATRNRIAELNARVVAAGERAVRAQEEAGVVASRLTTPALDTAELTQQCEHLQSELSALEEAEARARAIVEEADAERDRATSRLDVLRTDAGKFEVRSKESELERDSLLAGALERLDLGAAALLLAPLPNDENWDRKAEESELVRIRQQVRGLGTVNLGAMVELEEIEARLSELTQQRDDLERSIEDLRGTISKLNTLSKQRFKETFDAVDTVFRDVFPKLFRGGSASLVLCDENDLLETGVEIRVQPPGKRPGNLNLLSGGEKALTAICLIFSLFIHKPSPFCVLDEVDAPLDEANIGRFTSIVAEMSERSQFLIITHNKRTMEACRRLYGVTMPEAGITKIVSVDLDSAASVAGAPA
jgi:chromosome segregation protein